LAILFGLVAFIMPITTAAALIILFGAYALVDGIFAIVAAFRLRHTDERWWPLVFEGVFGIIAGFLAITWPGLTALTLITLVAVWAIFTGVLGLVAAARLRRHLSNEWLPVLSSIASIALGVLLILAPGAGLRVWVWMIGAYALLFGVLFVTLAFRLRDWEQRHRPSTDATSPPFSAST
jgi:uncharacterized membrane protein HdeD (DUF308 family)